MTLTSSGSYNYRARARANLSELQLLILHGIYIGGSGQSALPTYVIALLLGIGEVAIPVTGLTAYSEVERL